MNDEIVIDPNNIPYHVAIIMDGNGRWAKSRGKNRLIGHKKGLESLIEVLYACLDLNVKVVTVYAFSTENWRRPFEEITGLMTLFEFFFNREFKTIKKDRIKVIHSGCRDKLSPKILKIIDKMVNDTKDNDRAILNLCIDYSGRSEIIEAIKKYYSDDNTTDNLNEESFSKYLFHPDIPDPDLLIRTSGEKRLSNFLLWQSAYSELYFSDVLWPDFNKEELHKAIFEYQKRERRFGSHE